jgi:CheY-like chemotaxis protein
MAKLHGGYVTVESTLGHGSRFTVSLPLREPDVAQKARHSLPERHARPDLPVSRPRVLLAEDNDENIVVMQEYITRHGYEVVPVKTGTGAVAAAAELHPAIILMDIQMPEMDGLDAIARIRAMPALDSIPIIALTALAMPGDRERCLAAGANDYLSKPIGLRELIRVIERFLRAGQENQS